MNIGVDVDRYTHMLTITKTLDCLLTPTCLKLESSHSGENPYDSDNRTAWKSSGCYL